MRRAGVKGRTAPGLERRAAVDGRPVGVDDAAEQGFADGDPLDHGKARDLVAAAHPLKFSERHEERRLLAEAHDLAPYRAARGGADLAERADRQGKALALQDEAHGLPHPAREPDGLEIGQLLPAAFKDHPSSPRSI